MDNVYVLIAYVTAMVTLAGCIVAKVSDILEKKRDEKYYYMIKDDAAFWQMKVEQMGATLGDMLLDGKIEKMREMQKELAEESGEPKVADEEFRKMFDELDGLDDEEIII